MFDLINSFHIVSEVPVQYHNGLIYIVMSNALERSRNILNDTLLLSISVVILSITSKVACSVE